MLEGVDINEHVDTQLDSHSLPLRGTTTIEISRENLYKIKGESVRLKLKVRDVLDLILREYFGGG